MRCPHCNNRLAAHDLWCVKCGRQSPAVRNELSAMRSLKQTWQNYRGVKGGNVPYAAVAVLLGVIPTAILVWLSFSVINIQSSSEVGSFLLNLFLKAVILSLFLPFILMGFKPVAKSVDYILRVSDLRDSLAAYPRYFWFSLMNALYFMIIYVICFGLPNFGSDPILRLVFIVLVNYWMAVALPVPLLMERRKLGFLASLRLSYRHFHVVRWNLYLLALVLGLINLVAFSLLLIPLVITIPLSWFAIRDFTDLLLDFEIIRDQA